MKEQWSILLYAIIVYTVYLGLDTIWYIIIVWGVWSLYFYDKLYDCTYDTP